MANSIRPKNLHINGSLPRWVTGSLVPFLNEIPAKAKTTWPWTELSSVSTLADETWSMLGRWQARRAIKVDCNVFAESFPRPVTQLASIFNRMSIDCLKSTSTLRRAERLEWLQHVVDATMTLSAIKRTKTPKPMFGSKILHHFFPSVVPVFDTARVTNGLMTGSEFAAFREAVSEVGTKPNASETWYAVAAQFERDFSAMPAGKRKILSVALPFAQYVAFCAWLIEEASSNDLDSCRKVLLTQFRAQEEAQRGAAPAIADRLDAKIAELCATSAAVASPEALTSWVNDGSSVPSSSLTVRVVR